MNIACRTVLSKGVISIDTLVVRHADAIIRRGRQIPITLHLPTWTRVFSDEDPGTPTTDLQNAGQLLGVAALLFSLGVLVAFMAGTVLHWFTLAIGLGFPACIISILWLKLALSNRRRLSRRRSPGEGLRHHVKPLLEKDVEGAMKPGPVELMVYQRSREAQFRDEPLYTYLSLVWVPSDG